MQNSTNPETAVEPNFWLRQATEYKRLEIEADAAFLLEERAVAKVDHDYGWAAILIVWWFIWVLASYWKVAQGGMAAIPTFLILLAFGTTMAILAWVKTR